MNKHALYEFTYKVIDGLIKEILSGSDISEFHEFEEHYMKFFNRARKDLTTDFNKAFWDLITTASDLSDDQKWMLEEYPVQFYLEKFYEAGRLSITYDNVGV